MHFVKFHPEVASCFLSRGKRKYAPMGMRLLWKYIRNYFLVYHLTSHFLLYLQNYKEFEAEILDLQLKNRPTGFHLISKKCTTSGWALGDENVIGIRSFNPKRAGLFGPISQWRNIKCVVLVDSYDPPESIGTKKKSTNIPCMTPQWRHKWRLSKTRKSPKIAKIMGFRYFFKQSCIFWQWCVSKYAYTCSYSK